MNYDVTKLVKLAALKALAEKVNTDFATKVDLSTLSGKIDDIDIPTKISQLTNDSKYQTDTEVAATVATAIAETKHVSFETADAAPTASEAKDDVMYLVMNTETNHYDIYAKVGTEVVRLDDTTVDLSEYAKTADMNTALDAKVDAVEGMGLSSNDYTSDEKTKLAGVAAAATKVEASTTNGKVKINGVDTTVYTEPTDILHGEIATDTEVTEMLTEVFGA